MICKLCGNGNYKERTGSVRDNKDLKIYECCNCGLVFLSSISNLEQNFYEESSMVDGNLDIEKRRNEARTDDERRFSFLKNRIINKKLLDFGSGTGGFLKLVKPICDSVIGVELEKAVMPYYIADEIAITNSLSNVTDKFDYITAFHVIEHIKEPVDVLEEMSELLMQDGQIIVEVPNANDALLTIYKNSEFQNHTYWSCHLYLYTQHTLAMLAKKAGLKVEFIKHIQRYPLSNHLYWLSRNKPGGHAEWGNFIDSIELNNAYESQLAKLGATDTLIASFKRK